MSDKLNKEVIENLLRVKPDGNLYHRESQNLEFKESFNLAGLADYYRDFSAFANNKGGYLIFGVKDRPRRELIGLIPKAIEQFDKLDPEIISGHLLEIYTCNITWEHEIFEIDTKNYGVFYIYEANIKPIICKKDESKGNEQILKNGEIYYRYGGRTQKIQYAELEFIINSRIEQNNNQWMSLVQKIGKSGPQNAAILDTEKGIIEKTDSQILVIDEELTKNIKWIREGEFSEKKGEKTLKLIGSVHPVDQVEVIRKVKENLLKEYPLSAQELVDSIKTKNRKIKQGDIYRIINENNLKHNKEYADFVFRNNTKKEEYEKSSKVPNGTPSIYKVAAVDYIIKVHTLEYE